MFTHLIASRPDPRRDPAGLAVSLLLHASIIAAAVLATARTRDVLQVPQEPRIHVLPPLRPTPLPEDPRPATPPETPRVARPVDLQPTAAPEVPAPSLPVTTTVPVGIPEPGAAPVVPVPGGVPGGTGTAPAAGDPVGGLPGPGGVHAGGQVDVPAALFPRSPMPQYPEALRARRIEGTARVRFVVDTLGRVERDGIEVVEASHPAFAAAVRAALPRMRFRPARVGARPVRQLVEFPIAFRLEP